MKVSADIHLYQFPNVGCKLHDQIRNAVEITSAQDCRDLGSDFGQTLIDADMHSQISGHHAVQEFEWNIVFTRQMQHNHQFLKGIETHPIDRIPPKDFDAAFLGIFSHLLKRHMLIDFLDHIQIVRNYSLLSPRGSDWLRNVGEKDIPQRWAIHGILTNRIWQFHVTGSLSLHYNLV